MLSTILMLRRRPQGRAYFRDEKPAKVKHKLPLLQKKKQILKTAAHQRFTNCPLPLHCRPTNVGLFGQLYPHPNDPEVWQNFDYIYTSCLTLLVIVLFKHLNLLPIYWDSPNVSVRPFILGSILFWCKKWGCNIGWGFLNVSWDLRFRLFFITLVNKKMSKPKSFIFP